MLGIFMLTFAASVLRPEEPSTHRRVAAPLVHGQPFRINHNETISRLRAVASTTRLLTSDSSSPSSSQKRGDSNGTTEEMIAEKVTGDVWKGYSESNEEKADANAASEGNRRTDGADDADHDETTDADGAVMRTTGVTWALPEASAQASETSMVLANNSDGSRDDALPRSIPPVR